MPDLGLGLSRSADLRAGDRRLTPRRKSFWSFNSSQISPASSEIVIRRLLGARRRGLELKPGLHFVPEARFLDWGVRSRVGAVGIRRSGVVSSALRLRFLSAWVIGILNLGGPNAASSSKGYSSGEERRILEGPSSSTPYSDPSSSGILE